MLRFFAAPRWLLAIVVLVVFGVSPTLAQSGVDAKRGPVGHGLLGQLRSGPGRSADGLLAVGGDWLSVGSHGASGGTLEAWVRPRDRAAGRVRLVWGATRLRFRTRLTRPRWTLVAVSWDDRSVRLAVDGQTVESDAFGAPSGAGLGHLLELGTGRLNGGPSYVAVYGRAFAVRDVVAHYDQRASLLRPRLAPPASSSRVRAHAAAVPGNTALPVISGTVTDGQALSSTTGTWTGSPTSYTRQWQRCNAAGASCVSISGATATTYTLTSADVASTVRVAVTAHNASGAATATSVQTAAVAGRVPSNTAVPAISGTGKDGQTLTSTTGTWAGTTPITYTRQWKRCDSAGANCVAISGATATTYVLTAADVGSKILVAVTATNAYGAATTSSAVTALVTATAPTNSAVPGITGTAKEGQLLSASTGTWSGTSPTFSYQWQGCTPTCTAISGATASTYRPAAAQIGKTIKVQVTATNAAGSASAMSIATATVTTGAPVNTAAPAISGTVGYGQTLTVSNGSWVGTATVTFTRQWKRCDVAGANCTSIAGATASTYTLVSADVGATVKATVTASNGVGSTAGDSASTAVVTGVAPVNTTAAAVTGTAIDGQTLSSTTGAWSGHTPITFSRQWKRCDAAGANCLAISGATQTIYTLTGIDVGSAIVVAVTATNSAGNATASSTATAVVTAAGPNNTALPAITGSAADGQTLSATTGTWAGTTPINYTMQWQRCDSAGTGCAPITDETDIEYDLGADDLGHTVRVEVTASNPTASVSATSAATAVVVRSAPTNVSAPQLVGGQEVGESLSATPGAWTGSAEITYHYQWRRCDSDGDNCTNIPGDTAADHALTADDQDLTVRAVVTAINPDGFTIATSLQSTVVQPAPTMEPTSIAGTPQPLDPTDPEHLEETASIIAAISPNAVPGATCDSICQNAVDEYHDLIATLPPEDGFAAAAGSLLADKQPKGAVIADLVGTPSPSVVKNVLRRAAEVIQKAKLVSPRYATPVGLLVGANVLVWGKVYEDLHGNQVARVVAPPATQQTPMCGAPPVGVSCPITGERLVFMTAGTPLGGATRCPLTATSSTTTSETSTGSTSSGAAPTTKGSPPRPLKAPPAIPSPVAADAAPTAPAPSPWQFSRPMPSRPSAPTPARPSPP
jgi:uncharacterized protein YukE